MKLLLTTAIDKDHVNHLGLTALMEAVVLGDGGPNHTEIVRLLVSAGTIKNGTLVKNDLTTLRQIVDERLWGVVNVVRGSAPLMTTVPS